ncbi:MAG: helix-turn-helix transcriptional regulator [Clostridia bacterium]|nr:helix-turn-helix transcriptional regulator [Clostridia bacterium]
MGIDKKIAFCRKTLGISQEELAALLNISRQAVSRWETGAAMPDTEKIIQLSRVFHVSTDYLLLDEVEESRCPPEKTEPAHTQEPQTTESTVERFLAVRVQERRRKLRMAMWLSFLIGGFILVITAMVMAGIWANQTDWWWTKWGRFGTALFHTWHLAPFIIGFIVMLPGVAGLVYEYKRED